MRSYAWSRTAASTTQAGNHLGGGNLKDDDGPAEEGIEDNKHEDVFSCPTVPFSPHGQASLSDHGGARSSEKSVIKAMTGQGTMQNKLAWRSSEQIQLPWRSFGSSVNCCGDLWSR